MNFWYIGFLISWCILIIGNCYQGQNLIIPNTDKTDSNIYIYFQVLSTTTSVMLAIIIASTICSNYCNIFKWESDDFLPFVMFPLTIVQVTMIGLIGTNIESVSGESDTKNFKIILTVCGAVCAIPLFDSLYKIIKYLFPTPEEKAEREKNEEMSRNQRQIRHKLQQELDLKNDDRKHKIKLEHDNHELQRRNQDIIRDAEQDVLSKRKEIETQRATASAKRALEVARIEAVAIEEKELEEKIARESKVENDRLIRQANLKITREQRERKQAEIEDQIEMSEKIQKKDREEYLYKRKLDKQMREKQLSLIETQKMKQLAIYDREQLNKSLQLAQKQKESKAAISKIKEEILSVNQEIHGYEKQLDTAGVKPEVNPEDTVKPEVKDPALRGSNPSRDPSQLRETVGTFVSPPDLEFPTDDELDELDEKNNVDDPTSVLPTSTTAELDTDTKDARTQCETMGKELSEMQWCDSGRRKRDIYNDPETRKLLIKECQHNYNILDKHTQNCEQQIKDGKELEKKVHGLPEKDSPLCQDFEKRVNAMEVDTACNDPESQLHSNFYNTLEKRNKYGHCKEAMKRFDKARQPCLKIKAREDREAAIEIDLNEIPE